MVGLVVMGSLLRVWEVEVLDLNPAMESIWKIILCSRLIVTSVLDGARYTGMTYISRSLVSIGLNPTGRMSLWSHVGGRH